MSSGVRPTWLIGAWLVVGLMAVPWTGSARTSQPQGETEPAEAVKGSGCYKYGDNETPVQAKRAAIVLAQEDAVRHHRVFVQSITKVKNFQVQEDIIDTVSAAMLQDIKMEKEQREGQQVCVTISAKLNPVSMENMIKQRNSAEESTQAFSMPMVPENAGFALKVWTNKSDGQFLEGEEVVIYVQSEQSGYLKLDYLQADGCVVHLVPNLYRGQARIEGGKTYIFGAGTGPERFEVSEPYGAESIKAIVGTRPFDPSLVRDSGDCDKSADYIPGLEQRLRGLKVKGVEHTVSLRTISKAVQQYRKQRGTKGAE